MIKNSISAVAFTFNEENYIGELIDSIILQSIKVEKIIICDDFSTDKTKEVVARKRQEYKDCADIQLLENSKKGKVFAYEKALIKVDTDYFFVCGGDDVIGDTYVSEMLDFVTLHQIDFAYANPLWCDEFLNPFNRVKKELFYNFEDLLYSNWVGGFLFAKSNVVDAFLPFPEGLEFEDWYVGLSLSKIYGLAYINCDSSYFYRRHYNATTTVDSIHKGHELVKRTIRFYDYMLEFGVDGDFIKLRKLSLKSRIDRLSAKQFMSIIFSNRIEIVEKLKVCYFYFVSRNRF
ncbi:MAG: hypothetical protein RLZZ479_918 [Bacteroidota bacterium]|jgi:glycosyltransferase involved in cell wall biosynthesis